MKNINLIRSMAWSFNHTTGIEYEDLFSEASLAYYEGIGSYDENVSNLPLSAYLTIIMRNRLITYAAQEQKHRSKTISLDEIKCASSYELRVQEDYKNLFTEKQSQIISMILNESENYMDLAPKFARGLLVKKLREQGLAYNKIWTEIRKMKFIVNQMEYGSIVI